MRVIAGGLIAFILLGYYVYLVWTGCAIVVHCEGVPTCTTYVATNFTSMMAQLLSILGGLVSATVIAELAVTNRNVGQKVGEHLLPADSSRLKKVTVRYLTGFYILVWIGTGIAALVISSKHSDTLPPLTAVGLSWIGLAIAATYSYLGVQPTGTAQPS